MMNRTRRIALSGTLALLLAANLFTDQRDRTREQPSNAKVMYLEGNETMFQVGEELVYEVSYLFIKLGQVKLKVADKVQRNGGYVYKTIAYVDSYSGIPFVSLHCVYESDVSETVYSQHFVASELKDEQWKYLKYDYDYPSRRVIIEGGVQTLNTVEGRDTLQLETEYQDGLSLLYFARANVHQQKEVTIPTLIVRSKASTFINFLNEHDEAEIDSVDYPIDVVKFEGNANFVGLYGLTGAFKGWFSADSAAIPIKAKMKVFIGNVNIELRSWKRAGWIPPRKTDARE